MHFKVALVPCSPIRLLPSPPIPRPPPPPLRFGKCISCLLFCAMGCNRLQFNALSEVGARALARSLSHSRTLTHLAYVLKQTAEVGIGEEGCVWCKLAHRLRFPLLSSTTHHEAGPQTPPPPCFHSSSALPLCWNADWKTISLAREA